MKKIINSFLSTFFLLTRIHIPIKRKINKDYSLFPFFSLFIGLGISFLLLIIYLLSSFMNLSKAITSIVVLFSQYHLFNIFHLDGYADTIDAIKCFTSKEKKIKILKDSLIGTYALFYTIILILAKYLFLTELLNYPITILTIVFLYPFFSRLSMLFLSTQDNKIFKKGLGASLNQSSFKQILISTSIFIVIIFILLNFLTNIKLLLITLYLAISIVLSIITFLIVKRIYFNNFNGISGDAYGFIIEITEFFYLFFTYIVLKTLINT